MVSKKTRKAAVSPETKPESPPAPAELKCFFDGGGSFDNFSFSRWYWTGDGPRLGLADKIARKRFPVPAEAGSDDQETAAKTEFLVPAFAPAEYISLQHFLRRYDEAQPPHEVNAYVQITLTFPRAFNLHHPFEMARTFACREYVGCGMPVFMAGHAPWLAGSESPGHVHLIIFPRQLNQFGLGSFDHKLASDVGNREAYKAWIDFQGDWFQHWPRSLLEFG